MQYPLVPMPLFKRHLPNVIYRGTVLLACLACLLGVSGIFYFHHLDTRYLPPADTASVWLHGLDGTQDLQVVAEWTQPAEEGTGASGAGGPTLLPDADRERISEVGLPGEEAGIYLFQRAPEGVPLELIVYRNEKDRRVELHRQLAILTYGQSIYTAIPPGPAASRERRPEERRAVDSRPSPR